MRRPQTSKLMPVSGATLAYVEDGAGVPIVFVHGACCDLRQWEPQRAIAQAYRYVAYSFRYHWPNAWVGDGSDYSYEIHAADLASFIRGLGTAPVHVVGFSYGSQVSTLMALDHPDLVRSLTLVEPGLTSLVADQPEAKAIIAERSAAVASLVAAAKAGDGLRAVRLLIEHVTGEPGAFDALPEDVRAMLRSNERTAALLGVLKPPARSCTELGTLQAPALVLVSGRAIPFYAMVAEATARCLSHATKVVVPDTNHLMSLDRPEAFNEVLLRFLSRQGG